MSSSKLDQAVAEVTTESRNGSGQALPSKIAQHDLAYWRKVNEGMRAAQDQLNQAAQLEEQAQRLRTNAIALQGAFESHLAYLGETYQFDARTTVPNAEGAINRSAQDRAAE
jgi:hypothetical protein